VALLVVDSGLRLAELDDSVRILTPVGKDSVYETVLSEATALEGLLRATQGAELEIACVAADCREGLLPSRFIGIFAGTGAGDGDFAGITEAFAFCSPDGSGDSTVMIPFGWLISIRLLVPEAA
jgi:hypothetical protein